MCRKAMFGILFAIILVSNPLWAGQKEDAQKHFETGKKLSLLEDFASAASEFELSVRLFPTKSGLFNLANCYKALHRYDKALKVYGRLLDEFGSELSPKMKQAAESDVATLRSLVGELFIEVNMDGATIIVDGREVGNSPLKTPVVLSPGEHLIEIKKAGSNTETRKIVMVAGEKITTTYALTPSDKASNMTPPPLPGQPGQTESDSGGASSSDTEETAEFKINEEQTDTPESEDNPRTLSAGFWVAATGTLLVGGASGVFWGLSVKSHNEDNTQNAKTFNRVAIGTTIGAGALAVLTTVVLIRDIKRSKKAKINTDTVSLTPNGIAVRF